MQYVLVIHETPEDFDARTTDPSHPYIAAWRTYYQDLVASGVHVGGKPLGPVDGARVVRVRSGEPRIQDGPYAETKEHLGGFIVVEVPSLEEALQWAARCPVAATGSVEVRPVASDIHQAITD